VYRLVQHVTHRVSYRIGRFNPRLCQANRRRQALVRILVADENSFKTQPAVDLQPNLSPFAPGVVISTFTPRLQRSSATGSGCDGCGFGSSRPGRIRPGFCGRIARLDRELLELYCGHSVFGERSGVCHFYNPDSRLPTTPLFPPCLSTTNLDTAFVCEIRKARFRTNELNFHPLIGRAYPPNNFPVQGRDITISREIPKEIYARGSIAASQNILPYEVEVK